MAQGMEALQRRRKLARVLLEHRKIPEEGWDDATIEWFIKDLSMLDSNNFIGNVGALDVVDRSDLVAAKFVAC